MSAPSLSTPIRWGILGAGAIATRFARDLAHVPGATLATVYARRPEAAQALAVAHTAQAVSTPDALFTAGVDAIYIATLPDTHHHFARAALEAGLPVLCEKPVTRSLPELDDLLALATARNLLFMEAMKTPFLPLYRALRNHLVSPEGEGSIGPISFVQAGNASAYTPPDHPSWSTELAGGALMAIGVYQAFLAVDWLGPATETQALSQPSPLENHAVLSTEAERRGTTTVSASSATSSIAVPSQVDAFTLIQSRHHHGFSQLYAGLELASPGTATLSGRHGFATVHKPWWNPSRATIIPLSGPPIDLNLPVLGDGLHYETAHFCDLLRAGHRESPIVSHAHSRAVMHLLDQARAATHLHFPGEPFPPAPSAQAT